MAAKGQSFIAFAANMADSVTQLDLAVANAGLTQPERYEVNSDRLNWPLAQSNGVPGLPDGKPIMPTAR